MLKKIRLELGRTASRPEGDPNVAYEIVAPLDRDGHLDPDGWKAHRGQCTVVHYAPGAPIQKGVLLHTRGKQWAISYRPGEDDDEPIFRLESHLFKPGEYISVRGHDGALLPFRVVSMADA